MSKNIHKIFVPS